MLQDPTTEVTLAQAQEKKEQELKQKREELWKALAELEEQHSATLINTGAFPLK